MIRHEETLSYANIQEDKPLQILGRKIPARQLKLNGNEEGLLCDVVTGFTKTIKHCSSIDEVK